MKWNSFERTKISNFKFKEPNMKLITWLQARYKALVSALGGVLTYLYSVQVSNPNHWVMIAIIVLTVLGVHQVPNIKE